MNYVLTPTAVRKLRRAIAPTPGNTGAGGAPTTIHPDDFPPPFTVRWAQSENSGSGAWIIWLPDPARLLFYDEEWRTINQITAAQTMPAGWFTMNSIRDQDRTVYLSVRDTRREGSTFGLVEANISRTDSQGGSGGDYFYCGKVAVMEVDSDTGARRVKQLINSAVEIAKNGTGGGGTVTLDDTSTDWNSNTKVQIKDWDSGTPASSTTIAQDINSPPSNASALVERDSNGELKYKGLGTLAQLTGSYVTGEVTKTVVTNVAWNATDKTLDITKATVVIKDGTVKSWTEGQPVPIATTPISDIINQTS